MTAGWVAGLRLPGRYHGKPPARLVLRNRARSARAGHRAEVIEQAGERAAAADSNGVIALIICEWRQSVMVADDSSGTGAISGRMRWVGLCLSTNPG